MAATLYLYVVGTSASTGKALIDSYTNSQWSSKTYGTQGDVFYGIWGANPAAMIVVGSGGQIYSATQAIWLAVTSPTSSDLHAVWGVDTSHYWVVGASGAAFFRNGSTWEDHTIPNNPGVDEIGTLRSVWGTSASDVYVINDAGSVSSNAYVVHHWNGTAWSTVSGSNNAYYSQGIWGSAASDIWAVGAQPGATGHYIGSEFADVSAAGALHAVWGRASNKVWAVGDSGQVDLWDGASWSTCNALTAADLMGIAGGSTKTWAVGSGGVVLVNQ